MTVEALLKQLQDERMDAMTSVWIYGSKAQEAMYYGDNAVAKEHQRVHDENYKKNETLSMIIKEIEKRVS